MKFDLITPMQTTWTANNALQCALLSQLAYSEPTAIIDHCLANGYKECNFFEVHDTQGFVASNDDVTVLAFRGTEPNCLRDWLTDAEIAFTTDFGGLVHTGFLRALDAVWDEFEQHIGTKGPLFVTGHSLGAALATLATARLQGTGRPLQTYTFGSPRVGDPTFAAHYEAEHTYRYVNNTDVVTRVATRLTGYTHVGQLRYFDCAGRVQTNLRFWARFLDDMRGIGDDFIAGKPGLVGDHYIAEYVRLCNADAHFLQAQPTTSQAPAPQ